MEGGPPANIGIMFPSVVVHRLSWKLKFLGAQVEIPATGRRRTVLKEINEISRMLATLVSKLS
jgi:hypothetical protein